MNAQNTNPSSPAWGRNTKLVVALVILVIAGALLVKFQFILTPVMISLVTAYLLYPLAAFLQQKLKLGWGAAVAIIYAILLILLLALFTAGGVELALQIQSLMTTLDYSVEDLTTLIEQYTGTIYHLGPFTFDLTSLDLEAVSAQIMQNIQPYLGQAGSLVGSFAGGVANFIGWVFFILLVSYFVLAESGGLRDRMLKIDIPGYTYDIERLGRELSRIWNAFLRGQIILFLTAIIVYTIALSLLGVRYALSLALIAGIARFIPYVGPAINWIILVIVTYFQSYKLFGLEPLYYTLLVLIIALVIDQIFDYVVSPRIYSDTLSVHPAAVLVATIIAASLLGLLGVVIAAPMLATVLLLWRYIMKKMLDMNPWPEEEAPHPPPPTAGRFIVAMRRLFRRRNTIQPAKK